MANSRGERSLVLRLSLLLAVCGLSGLVLAGMLLPAVGGIGLAAKGIADHFEDLPSALVEPVLAQRTQLLDDQGHVLAQLHGAEDRVVIANADDIPAVMKRAIVAIEDSRFYEHHGVDFQGVARALVRNGQAGATAQGASTITQQYVKNALIEDATSDAARKAASADTTARKLQEARYALALEQKYSKDEILRRYLNIADFGDGVYGVGTAAQHYFRVPLAKISLAQAALLAGIVNSPARFDPFLHPVAAAARRNVVLDRMASLGLIGDSDKAAAEQVAMPTKPKSGPAPADACVGSEAPFFCAYARNLLQNDKALGDTASERNNMLFGGGLQVKTTLDMKVQAATQSAVDQIVPNTSAATVIVAAVQPGTGKVLAIASNRTYTTKKGAGRTSLGYLGYQPIFQGGSTFKLFTLAAALASGVPVHTSFFAPGCYVPPPAKFGYDFPAQCSTGRGFQNSDKAEQGTYDLVNGTWDSVNTFFIQLEEQVGVKAVIQAAEAMGVAPSDFAGLGQNSLSVTLGGVPRGVSPLEEATAYATIAAHGIECNPTPVASIHNAENQPITLSAQPRCHQVLTPAVADTISGILQGVLTQGTAAGKGLTGRTAAGKTGTLDQQKAAWFTGFTSQLAMAVVIGNPAAPVTPINNDPLGSQVSDVTPNSNVFGDSGPLFGGTLPATIWNLAMNAALVGEPAVPLPPAIAGSAPIVAAPLASATASASPKPSKGGKKGGKPTVTPTGALNPGGKATPGPTVAAPPVTPTAPAVTTAPAAPVTTAPAAPPVSAPPATTAATP